MNSSKVKRKIYIPKDINFNFIGLIIGPRGANQKRLEEETGCKILIRGRSRTEGTPPQPNDDEEDLHVLIIGDNESQLENATAQIERTIFAGEETRSKIRQEQLKLESQIKDGISTSEGKDLSMTTPYGPPRDDAYVIQVPNDCVGLVIGKGGETIRQLHMQSGAKKIQVAGTNQEGKSFRNIFVEADKEAYEKAKAMINDIIEHQRKIREKAAGDSQEDSNHIREEVPVPDGLIGLVIGKGGQTIMSINKKTGCSIFVPKESEPGKNERMVVVKGTAEQVELAKKEITDIVEEGLKRLQFKALEKQYESMTISSQDEGNNPKHH